MNYIDIFFGVFFILTAIKGYSKGFVVELFSIIALFVGLFVAIEFTAPLAVKFFSDSQYFEVVSVGVFLLIFIGFTIVINLVARVIKKVIDLSMLGMFDNVLGAVLGLLKFALIMSVVLWIFDSLGLKLPGNQQSSSIFLPYIEPIGPAVFSWVSDVIPYFKHIFDSLEQFGSRESLT
ncbi:MAG: CvpA family protein [Cyclobacteriaceae bacterium]